MGLLHIATSIPAASASLGLQIKRRHFFPRCGLVGQLLAGLGRILEGLGQLGWSTPSEPLVEAPDGDISQG